MRNFTAEHLKKKRLAATGKKYPNRKPMSEEQKAKLRANFALRPKPKKEEHGFQIRNKDLPPPSDVIECKECSRYYLSKLGCLFCTVYEKNRKLAYMK